VNDVELSLVPLEARPYQGTAAGIVTRAAANAIDYAAVSVALVGAYAGFVALRFVLAPRNFRVPAPSLDLVVVAFFACLVLYLTAAWWISGRTLGDHVMGIRVVTGHRSRLGFARALARALLCSAFPVGLLWCAADSKRRSLQDLVLRTSVVYDWLPRPTSPRGDEDRPLSATQHEGSSPDVRSS
jgi:uncharacterized RDD family membrane protein YckC